MNTKLSRLSAQYLTALREHLKAGPKASLQPATQLGRQAVALGLETLDLFRIHEQALAALVSAGASSRTGKGRVKRARAFFAQAIVPIEKTHRPALRADAQEKHLNQTLRQRTAELSASARHLQRGVAQHRAAEAALKKSGKHRRKLLQESRRLQKHSQHLTRETLATQESEWRQISRQLHDEIAQILLGIDVRLLTLKQAAKANTGGLKREIASTQRVVKQSVRTINQFAHEFGLHHET